MFPTLALKVVHVWIEYNFVHKETKDTALWQVIGSNGRLGAKVSMFQWWALTRMNVFWDKAIGHTSTSVDHGVAFERFCKRLVHLVQFL